MDIDWVFERREKGDEPGLGWVGDVMRRGVRVRG